MFSRNIKKFAGRQLLCSFGKFLYFIGLTALIPFLPILITAPFSFGKFLNQITSVSIFLFSLGALLIFIGTGSVKKTFRSLGFATLLPAVVAFIFSFFGKNIVLSVLSSFNITKDVILPWIDKYVPSVLMIAGIYLIIGIILIFVSSFFRD